MLLLSGGIDHEFCSKNQHQRKYPAGCLFQHYYPCHTKVYLEDHSNFGIAAAFLIAIVILKALQLKKCVITHARGMQGLYAQGKSGRKVSFSLRPGKVREARNDQGKIALWYCRSEGNCRF